MRFKVFYLADTALLNHLLNAEKIAVPAAVMEDREQALFFLRKRNQISRFLHIQRKWLIHHYVLAGVERRGGQRRMGRVRGGDNHRVDIRVLNSLFRGGNNEDVRQIAFDLFFIPDETTASFRPSTDWISGA